MGREEIWESVLPTVHAVKKNKTHHTPVVWAKKKDSFAPLASHSGYSWHPDLSTIILSPPPTNLLTTQFHFPPFIQFLLSFILERPQFSSNCMPACFSLQCLESFPCLDLPNTFAYSHQRSLSFFLPPHGPSYLSVCDIESLLYSNLLLGAHPTKTTNAELVHIVIVI